MKLDINGFVRRWFAYLLSILITFTLVAYIGVYEHFARPRHFKGDFYAAMYDPTWWDGTGLFYGPLFVFEKWIVNLFPKVVTVEFFSVQVLILIVATLFIALKIVHADKVFIIFGLFVWLSNSYFYYSYSVAANPEMLELLFLLLMWWAISRRLLVTAHVFFAIAVITKLVPIILLPILLLNFSPYGLVILAAILIGSIILVSIGQNENVFTIIKDLVPPHVAPQPKSEQFLGLSNAITRLLGASTQAEFRWIVLFSMVLIIAIYIFAAFVGYKFHKVFGHSKFEVSSAYVFTIFMCLMPLMHTSNTHRHTFLFIAPIWIALRFIYLKDPDTHRSKIFARVFNVFFVAYSILPIYFLDIFQVSKLFGIHLGETTNSLVMLTEPMWTNLALLTAIICYGLIMIKDEKNFQNAITVQPGANID